MGMTKQLLRCCLLILLQILVVTTGWSQVHLQKDWLVDQAGNKVQIILQEVAVKGKSRDDVSGLQLHINLGRSWDYTHFSLNNPDRVVLDIRAGNLLRKKEVSLKKNFLLSKLRIGSYPDKTRIVLEVLPGKEILSYVARTSQGYVVTLFDSEQEASLPARESLGEKTGPEKELSPSKLQLTLPAGDIAQVVRQARIKGTKSPKLSFDRKGIRFVLDAVSVQELTVTNQSSEILQLNVSVGLLERAGFENQHTVPTNNLQIIPQEFVLKPNASRVLAVKLLSSFSKQEQVYVINVLPDTNSLGFGVLALVEPSHPLIKLDWRRDIEALHLRNLGNMSVFLHKGRACQADNRECKNLPAIRVYSGNYYKFKVPAACEVRFLKKIGRYNEQVFIPGGEQ